MSPNYPSIYEKLDSERSEVRLVEILSDGPDSLVKCRLSTVSLDEKPLFLALSYVWGDPEITEDIIIDDHTSPVTRNLEAALRHVCRQWMVNNPRFNRSRFLIWIDAICINQADVKEREQQVGLMRRIFRLAGAVLAWLGPKDHSIAFKIIRSIAQEIPVIEEERSRSFSSFNWLRKHPDLLEETTESLKGLWNNPWQSVRDLLAAQYWDRLWIFQEAVLARRLHLFSPGAFALDGGDLKLVVTGMRKLAKAMKKGTVARPAFVTQVAWRAIVLPSMGWHCVDRIVMMRGQMKFLTRRFKKECLGWILASAAGSFIATNPKDYIYGLLGVTALPIKPDYTSNTSLSQLYMEYAQGWLKASRPKKIWDLLSPLDFLSEAGSVGSTYDLPTWVPNFPSTETIDGHKARISIGNASRKLHSGAGTYPYVKVETKSLFVWGVKVDLVTSVNEASTSEAECGGRSVDFIADFMARHEKYITGIPPFQAFVRLVSRDISQTVNKVVILKAMALLALISNTILLDNVDTISPYEREKKVIQRLGFPMHLDLLKILTDKVFPGLSIEKIGFNNWAEVMGPRHNGPLSEAVEILADDVTETRHVGGLIETSKGYLGISSIATVPGDILCVLDHCDVPVVLRLSPDMRTYSLVGTTFILGLMNGEAAELVGKEGLKPEWFELR